MLQWDFSVESSGISLSRLGPSECHSEGSSSPYRLPAYNALLCLGNRTFASANAGRNGEQFEEINHEQR
jgi:hypothetical protein